MDNDVRRKTNCVPGNVGRDGEREGLDKPRLGRYASPSHHPSPYHSDSQLKKILYSRLGMGWGGGET